MGDTGLGSSPPCTTTPVTSRREQGLRRGLQRRIQALPDMFSVGAYDGMHVIYEALKKTKGDTDA